MGNSVDVDLLHNVANPDRRGRRSPLLDLVAQRSQAFGLDLSQQVVPEDRQDVPIDDVLAHGAGAVGQPCVGQLGIHRRAEGLDCVHPALLALLLLRGRDAIPNALAGIEQQFARHRQRSPVMAVAAEGRCEVNLCPRPKRYIPRA